MSRRQPIELKSLKQINNAKTYTTGEVRGLLKALGLPHSKPWFYERIEDPTIKAMFIRPNPRGHRYIVGVELKELVNYLKNGC